MPGEREAQRLSDVSARLKNSPALEAAVREAISTHRVPAVTAELTDQAVTQVERDADRLERLVALGPLEAIVQRVGRPPLLIRDDAVVMEPLPDLPRGTPKKIESAERFIPSIGRVEFVNARMPWGGTGWVIAKDGDAALVATNRHVARIVARRVADGRGVFLRSTISGSLMGADLDFHEEVGSRPQDARPFEVADIVYLADDAAPDVAVLRIVGDHPPEPVPLAATPAVEGELVAVVGYPAFDDRNDIDAQARYFRDLFEVKRFAPGRVMQPLTSRTTLRHDCTTLGGNSGSPVISLDHAGVVGLHFAGVFGKENSAVGVDTLRRLVESDFRPRGTGPIEAVRPETEAPRDGKHSAADLAGRSGYDPVFLGRRFATPWPGLPESVLADLARPSDETEDQPGELRYVHFGVRYSASRRQPRMTAVNIDGSRLVPIKRSNDRWFHDGRIDRDLQLDQDDYRDPRIDRGHMVRRQDPNWDEEVAEQANADTFHYTNAALQHSELNQGTTLWLGLEDLVLDSARTHGFMACVFTGPVLRDDDPEIVPGLPTPLEFWKVVAMVDADRRRLHATAYLLSQGQMIRDLLEKRRRTESNEGFVLGAYRTFQIAVRDLADATGYDLSAYTAADPLDPRDDTHESVGFPAYVALERPEDAVL
ncbi:DNA/RNA non-specific endonuclease [Actinomycetospora lutea]|uniref:DNA/RNA non-specific endonuclease n=1 Tax=Actinomycetospora lutea TaxID=663604 RepID=UPI0023651F84|nr:DNA/RNA non-specific endonuclease [Actinomycetospora lutea]MDD7936944.1 DNA/RNA non-specific endonuclease [Actinomycetospora lutea]